MEQIKKLNIEDNNTSYNFYSKKKFFLYIIPTKLISVTATATCLAYNNRPFKKNNLEKSLYLNIIASTDPYVSKYHLNELITSIPVTNTFSFVYILKYHDLPSPLI